MCERRNRRVSTADSDLESAGSAVSGYDFKQGPIDCCRENNVAGWRDALDDPQPGIPAGLQQQTIQRDPAQQQFNANGMQSTNWRESVFAAGDSRRQPKWQTGGQQGSLENSWNDPFYQKMFAQRDAYNAQ